MLYNASDKWNKIWVRSCPTGMWEEIFRMRKNASTRIDFLKIYMEIFQSWHWNDPPSLHQTWGQETATSFLSCVVLQELCVIFLRFCLPCVIIHVIWLFFCGLWAYSKPELEGLWHYGHTQSASHTHITKDAGSDWASMPVFSYFLSPHFPQSPQQRI